MKFDDALRAMAKGYTVKQPGIKLMERATPIHTSGLVTPDVTTFVRDNWIMCRVVVNVADERQRPVAFTAEEMAMNNWEVVT